MVTHDRYFLDRVTNQDRRDRQKESFTNTIPTIAGFVELF